MMQLCLRMWKLFERGAHLVFPVCQKIESSSVCFPIYNLLTCSGHIDAVLCVLPVTNGNELSFFCISNEANSPEKLPDIHAQNISFD